MLRLATFAATAGLLAVLLLSALQPPAARAIGPLPVFPPVLTVGSTSTAGQDFMNTYVVGPSVDACRYGGPAGCLVGISHALNPVSWNTFHNIMNTPGLPCETQDQRLARGMQRALEQMVKFAEGLATGTGSIQPGPSASSIRGLLRGTQPRALLPPAPPVVRPYRPSDYPALQRFDQQGSQLASKNRSHYGRDFLKRAEQVKAEDPDFLVAVDGDEIVGAMTLNEGFDGYQTVHRLQSNQPGTGTQLLQEAFRVSKARGGEGIMLLSDGDATGFYDRMGPDQPGGPFYIWSKPPQRSK